MNRRIVHCKREHFDVYIGRPSIWGNPFTHIKDRNTQARFIVSSREKAIEAYNIYLKQKIKNKEISLVQLAQLHNKVLGCWCSPKPCHGDILLKAAAWAHKQVYR